MDAPTLERSFRPAPPEDEAQVYINEIERLAQFWKAGLLSKEEFQTAVSKLLGANVPARVFLWEYDYDEVAAPRD